MFSGDVGEIYSADRQDAIVPIHRIVGLGSFDRFTNDVLRSVEKSHPHVCQCQVEEFATCCSAPDRRGPGASSGACLPDSFGTLRGTGIIVPANGDLRDEPGKITD